MLRPVLQTNVAWLALVWIAHGGAAHANPAGVVPSTGGGQPLHVDVDFEYGADTALITRERADGPAGAQGALPIQSELTAHQSRALLTPKVELGVYRGIWVSFAAPIVLLQSSRLDLADGVAKANSSTFTDAILPANGFDARAPATPLAGNTVFHGVDRSGVLELRGGVGIAPMSQAFDDTKPTWKIGAELHVPVGREMRFAAANPGAETGVSTGVYDLRLWTSVDRRYRYFESWFEAFWQGAVGKTSGSLFQDPGFGAIGVDPGQIAGVGFGIEAYVVDNPASGNRVSIDLGMRLTGHFEGRGYSEMWETFALAGDTGTGGPLVVDADPVQAGVQAQSYPGVSSIESYLDFAPRLAVRAQIGPHIRLAATAELIWRTQHVISFADAGVDLPTCAPGATAGCEVDNNDLINPATAEVNPLQVPLIDLVGHRYHAADSHGFVLGLSASTSF
jgi:hypothetical protein